MVNHAPVSVLVRQRCSSGASVPFLRGTADDLRPTCKPRTHTILVGSHGSVHRRPAPVRDRPRLCRPPGRLWRFAGTIAGRPRRQRRGDHELGPTGQSWLGGPAGLSDRSGAQAGIEPATAAVAASLSSAPPGRYELSTPVHCRCERHPHACRQSFETAVQSRNLSALPRHRAGEEPMPHRARRSLWPGPTSELLMVTTLRSMERNPGSESGARAGIEPARPPEGHGQVGSGPSGTTMSTQLHHRGCPALRSGSARHGSSLTTSEGDVRIRWWGCVAMIVQGPAEPRTCPGVGLFRRGAYAALVPG